MGKGLGATNRPVRRGLVGFLVLSLLIPFPALAQSASSAASNPAGRLTSMEAAEMVVRRETFACGDSPLLLLTLASEGIRDRQPHFHPLASLAFDPTLASEAPGQWMGLWTYGPSPAGWRRTVRSFLPLPVGAPKTSARKLEELETRLDHIEQGDPDASLLVPDPVLHLANLEKFQRADSVWGWMKRGFAWTGVVNPAQFVFRSFLTRRKDRKEREFQRAYLALQWLQDLEFRGAQDPVWLDTLTELRYHLLRNRSPFGVFLDHAGAEEMVRGYESATRVKLGKSSSWLQSAANEHYLRFQPIYRHTRHGTPFPMGGVLYYDQQLGAHPDPAWWKIANPFDLSYNPRTHPEVQRLAREHPDEWIPLALYTFQTNLALRPIIAIDFFDTSNPRRRESAQQSMVLLKHWLALTTGALSFERLPYRVVTWAANKKGYTYLVDKSARVGNEELRLALQAGLYFDPERRSLLLRRADQRALNPLLKAGAEEEHLAHIQYESLRARDAEELCRAVDDIREKMMEELNVPHDLAPAERRAQLARRLLAWQNELHLAESVSQPVEDYGSLAALEAPLRHFLEEEPLRTERAQKLLARLYAKLYRQELLLPPGRTVPELATALALTREVWQKTTDSPEEFSRLLHQVEEKSFDHHRKEMARERQDARDLLRSFLEESRKHLKRARRAGCAAETPVPAELEAHLAILHEVLQVASTESELRREIDRQTPELRRELVAWEQALAACPVAAENPWLVASRQDCAQLARMIRQQLDGDGSHAALAGGN